MAELLYHECMGARIAYQRPGGIQTGKPTVLYLRSEDALPGDADFMNQLSNAYDLIIPDHPGFGASDNPDWFRGMADVAYFYLDFLQALDVRDIHVVGASMGGWIGAEIAVRDASRIASLSLVAPLGVRQRGHSYGDVFLATPEQNIRNLFADQKWAEKFLGGDQSSETTTAILKNRYATARIGWAPRFHNPELQRWLHRISPPVLLLWGDGDKIAPPAMAQAWQQGLPASRLVHIPDCGHLPHMEAQERTFTEISAFIQEAHS